MCYVRQMRAFDVVIVMIGGGLGSALRYGVSFILTNPQTGTFPVSTLVVNIVGSAVVGLILGLSSKLSATTVLFLGTGLCGGFTTFSTFSGETLTMLGEGRYGGALAYVGVSLVGGLASAAAAFALARRFVVS